ncbi:MAG: hypothetical protein KF830_15950 [Planctomycetes bacterium]|nr:hypothetical protein [Planctomycetota bacterium]
MAVVILGGPSLMAQSLPLWTSVAAPGPTARKGHALADDAQRQLVLLFGGEAQAGLLADTWEWDGVAWQVRTPPSAPPARRGHGLAYDAARQRTVLFGGEDTNGLLGDTWEWDGTDWAARTPAAAPPARQGHAMAYDAARQRIVLFGGSTAGGLAADTWQWDGSTWQQVATGWAPPGRAGHAMTYDAGRQRIVLFGGDSGSALADTWEWNGSFWAAAFTAQFPPARTGAGLAYAAAAGRTLLFGGAGAAGPRDDTWEFLGSAWVAATPTAQPSARTALAMAYDAARERVVLFGGDGGAGIGLLGDTWLSGPDPVVAAASTYGAGCGTPPLAMAPDPAARPVLGQVGRATIANTPSAVGAVAMGASRQFYGPFLLPVTLAGIGMPGCDLLQSADILGWAVAPTSPDTAAFAVAFPDDASLRGVHAYLQAYFVAPGANALEVVVSNGVDWRIGDLAPPFQLVETFATSSQQDLAASAAAWNQGARPGLLGGDGRHGSFDVTLGLPRGGGVYEWNTDQFLIPASRTLDGQDHLVTDGRFAFTDFVLPAGTTLRATGSAPLQIWVTGAVDLQGTIDVGAPAMPFWIPTSGPAQGQRVSLFNGIGPSPAYSVAVPNWADGQPGGAGGPGGGRGGAGAPECRLNGNVQVMEGLELVNLYYGRNGESVRVPAGHAYAASAAGTGGRGSLLHPLSGLAVSLPLLGSLYRGNFSPGGGGGGFDGPGGQATVTPPAGASVAAIQPGGTAFPDLAPVPTGFGSLDHFLVGGSGGGGGGSHVYGTQNSAAIGHYVAGAGGSGGGGALLLRAGGPLTVGGSALVAARGGEGVLVTGDNPNTSTPDATWGVTSPGGGGSGGSVLLQSGASLSFAGAVDVRGGDGSRTGSISILPTGTLAVFNIVSQAGAGAPGFYRLEAAGAAPAFSGTGAPAFDPQRNAARLQDRDAYTASASKWYAAGQTVPPIWQRYELDVDLDGDGVVDVTYTDSGAPGTVAANDPMGPVRIRFQGAVLDASGTAPVPGPLPPWRDGIGLGAGPGILQDGVTGVRFQLVFHGAAYPNVVVRGLRIHARR